MANSHVGKYADLVKGLLTQFPNLRDDVGLLYIACVAAIKGREYTETTSLYKHFKENVNNEKFPSISSVVRLNTKTQTENKDLRGINWKERQKHTKAVQGDLGYKVK